MEAGRSPICWTLLIGINFYPDDDETEPLEGCVRDVEGIEHHLKDDPSINMIVLKASTGNNRDSRKPLEPEDQWPTLDNIRLYISNIIDKAAPGDLVHIHFSGHGVRRKTQSKDFGDHENGDLAFVLYDPISDVSYLQGFELAKRLKDMVDRALQPVVVLDCCNSGAVLRGPHGRGKVREAVYNAEIDRRSTGAGHLTVKPGTSKEPRRDGEALPNWLLDPNGYAVITACGPSEVSREVEHNGYRNGPLTHVLLPALRWMSLRHSTISLQSIHDYVSVNFRAGLVTQSPRRYGNPQMCLLSPLRLRHNSLEKRVFHSNDELILEDGEVGAVAKNDEYHLQPLWRDRLESTEEIIFKVKTVYTYQSILEPVDPSMNISMVKTAWRATPCTHLSRRAITIELSPRLQPDQWQEAMAMSRFLISRTTTQNPSTSLLSVLIDIKEETEYQIVNDGGRQIPGLPTVPTSSPSAIKDTINLLDHLAKYKYIESIDNRVPNLDFESTIKTEMATSSGGGQRVEEDGGILHVRHGDIVSLRCFNLSQEPAYLVVFDLTPSLRVHNVLKKKYGAFKDVQRFGQGGARSSSDTEPLNIKMGVPKELDARGECEDMIKIFVTSRPVSLASLELEAVDSSVGQAESNLRDGGDSLLKALEILSPPTRGPGSIFAEGSWLTRSFVIRVSKGKETSDGNE